MSSLDPGAGIHAQTAMRNLRPLSIGEMLDRAFSICFGNLLSFLSLVAVVVIPQLVFYYLGSRDILSTMMGSFGTLGTTAGNAPTMDVQKVFQAEANGAPYFIAVSLIALFLVPLSNAAVVSGVSRAYLGLPVRFAQCYADALPRWLTLVLLMLLWIAAIVIAFTVFLLAFVIVGAAIGVMISLLGTVGTVIAVLIGVAVGIGGLLLALELYLAAAYSFVAAVLEKTPLIVSFASGFQRVFGEGQFWRSLGIAAAIFGIIFGLELVAGIVGAIAIAFTHSFALDFVVSGLVGAFSYPFLFAVVAVSYYDVRIRREGFDLQMLAAQIGAAGATPAR